MGRSAIIIILNWCKIGARLQATNYETTNKDVNEGMRGISKKYTPIHLITIYLTVVELANRKTTKETNESHLCTA